MHMQFEGRVALVTGGARGIGGATCDRLAAGGAAVAVVDVDGDVAAGKAAEIRAAGGRALGLGCDVTSRAQVEATMAKIVEHFGRLDILVTCAGIIRDNLIYKMTDDDWDAVINTHLKGSFLCAQAAQRQMVPRKYGRIVLISSTSALGNRGQTNYSTAKAGLQGMAKTLAVELGPYGITANAVAPGFIVTRMTEATAARMGVDFDAFQKLVAEQTPLRRVGTPEEVANVIAFLASDEASYVSGQVIYVAGGPKN